MFEFLLMQIFKISTIDVYYISGFLCLVHFHLYERLFTDGLAKLNLHSLEQRRLETGCAMNGMGWLMW